METPTTQYLIDDAGVLNKTTRKSINNTLTSLEVNTTASSSPCSRTELNYGDNSMAVSLTPMGLNTLTFI